MSLITTFAEHREGELKRPSLETLSEARRLADASGGQVQAVVIGSVSDEMTSKLAAYGADRVHVFGAAELGQYATEPYTRAIAQVVESTESDTLLIPFTAMGKDLASTSGRPARRGASPPTAWASISGTGSSKRAARCTPARCTRRSGGKGRLASPRCARTYFRSARPMRVARPRSSRARSTPAPGRGLPGSVRFQAGPKS